MSEKQIKVRNNKDRYFNGVKKGGILTVPESRKNYYLRNGFSLVGEIETKENIVKKDEDDPRTKNDLKKILDHHGVKYDNKANKTELLALVGEIETKEKTEGGEEGTDELSKIIEQLVAEKIVEEKDLVGKSGDEIMQIAKDNGLI